MCLSLALLNIRSQASLNDKCLTLLYRGDMSIGARIIQLRKAHKPKKLSQEALGELCEVSKSAVSQWESGTTEPDIKTLVKLRSKLVFSLDWLLTGEGVPGMVYRPNPIIEHVINAMQNMEKRDAERLAAISDTFKRNEKSKDDPETYGDPDYYRSEFEETSQPEQAKREKKQ